MEKIERRNGRLYYGNKPCRNANEAYLWYRDAYHYELGKQVYKRLDRIGQRTERTHGIGYYYAWEDEPQDKEFWNCKPTRYYVMGILGISYCYMVGSWDMPSHKSEEEFDRWYYWAFEHGSRGLTLAGWKKFGSGRTSLRYLKEIERKKLNNKISYGRRKERINAEAQL